MGLLTFWSLKIGSWFDSSSGLCSGKFQKDWDEGVGHSFHLAEIWSPLIALAGFWSKWLQQARQGPVGFVLEPSGITVVQISNDSLSLKAVTWSVTPASWTHGAETSGAFSRHDYIGVGSSSRLICPSGLTLGGKIEKTRRSYYNICNFKECPI